MSTSLPLRDDGAVRASFALALFVLLGLGLGYSLVATGITSALMPDQAHGSLLRADGRVIGSSLVAQPFADARYFQPRPSAAKYDPTAAAGSNQARSIQSCWRGSPPHVRRLHSAMALRRMQFPASCSPSPAAAWIHT